MLVTGGTRRFYLITIEAGKLLQWLPHLFVPLTSTCGNPTCRHVAAMPAQQGLCVQ